MVSNGLTQILSQIGQTIMTLLTFSYNPNPSPNPMHNPTHFLQYFAIEILDRCSSKFSDLMY